MARRMASRKYQLTINNPLDHALSHPQIEQILSGFPGLDYWCMCDEIGEEGTPHTHIYIIFKNAVMFDTLHKRFYGAHIEMAQGSNQENRDYIRKEGKWLDNKKQETNQPETFEESGELPPDRSASNTDNAAIYEMLKDGASDFEILEAIPNALNKLEKFDRARQAILEERYKNQFRALHITYLWGKTRSGKTRSVMDKYGYGNVYRITDYKNPFDGYRGQDVIVFEEFRSSLPIQDMLKYLDGYPLALPCCYYNKQACYTQIYIITNIPFEKQYPQIQRDSPGT